MGKLNGILFLLLTILVVGCGRSANQETADDASDAAMNQALGQSTKEAPTSLSADAQFSQILNKAFPNVDKVIVTSAPTSSSNLRGATKSGTTPNGSTWVRKNGSFVAADGTSIFAAGGKISNPNTGAKAGGAGLWIPGVGAISFAAAYNPQTGKLGVGLCYGSLAYATAGCYACTLAGCNGSAR